MKEGTVAKHLLSDFSRPFVKEVKIEDNKIVLYDGEVGAIPGEFLSRSIKSSLYIGGKIFITIQPANTEVEEVKNNLSDIMNDLVEETGIDFKVKAEYYQRILGEVESLIKINSQSIPPRVTQEEICELLKKYFSNGYEGYDIKIEIIYNKIKKSFTLLRGRTVSIIASITESGVSITRKIPKEIAHKITTFFTQEEKI